MQWADRSWEFRACSIFSGSLNSGHYTSMTRDVESATHTHYNDDFVTKYRERTALKNLRENTHGLVYGLVYIQTWKSHYYYMRGILGCLSYNKLFFLKSTQNMFWVLQHVLQRSQTSLRYVRNVLQAWDALFFDLSSNFIQNMAISAIYSSFSYQNWYI